MLYFLYAWVSSLILVFFIQIMHFSSIEEGIKLQRILVLVILFYFISGTPSGTESIFGRMLLSAIRKASSSVRNCFKIWCKKR